MKNHPIHRTALAVLLSTVVVVGISGALQANAAPISKASNANAHGLFRAETYTPVYSPVVLAQANTKPHRTEAEENQAKARRRGFLGAAKGCGLAAGLGVLGRVLGNGNQSTDKEIAAQCIAVGIATGLDEYGKALEEANALANQKGAGVTSGTVTQRDVGNGKQGLDKLTLKLDPTLVGKRDPKVREVMDKAARIANDAKQSVTITVNEPTSDAWVSSYMDGKIQDRNRIRLVRTQNKKAPLSLTVEMN